MVGDPANPGNQGVNVIDTSELLNRMLSNEQIPEELREQFWALWTTSLKLSRLTPKAVEWYHNKFRMMENLMVQELPVSEYNTAMRTNLSMIEMEFYSNLHRALDGFERTAETMQINANTDNVPTIPGAENMGLLARFSKAISGGGD